ncbi:hypothetical protein [Marinomonas spartinae]|uniref:hypothetical protein n=1 Tax=Marinomonas spartinae TaxID=1792290 RepID=UPI0018F12C9D|nr:hypothetical protein [Marinomonas spartinae]MBJ7556614.1 hypothetical protein [Marinomonas spartinae]
MIKPFIGFPIKTIRERSAYRQALLLLGLLWWTCTGQVFATEESETSTSQDSLIYYQLSASDFDKMQQDRLLRDKLQALSLKQFEQRSQLINSLSEVLSEPPLSPDPSIDLGQLIQSQSIPIKSDKTPTSETQSATQTDASQIVWVINTKALETVLSKQHISNFSQETLQLFKPLQGEVFYSLYMLYSAIKLAGIPTTFSDVKSIVSIAKKSGIPPEQNNPVIWNAPANCGCEDSLLSIFSVGTFYGLYPYWDHPKTGQTINFSQLDRIGFVGAVITPNQKDGSKLILPPNWQPQPENSQFVQMAHRYRSNVDLVVTAAQKPTEKRLTEQYNEQLIQQIVASITQPLDQYFINRMEPIVSFGLTPIPTIGDGITLDINLSALKTQQSQQQFLAFVRNLKKALLLKANSKRANAKVITARPNDRYYLNIIIPVEDVIAPTNNGFYQFDNLKTLAQLTNLIIMRPSTPNSSQKAADELTQIQELRYWLSLQKDQLGAEQVFKRITPMLVTEDNRNQQNNLTQLVRLSRWSFLGAAYWPLPLNSISQSLIDRTFFPTLSSYPPPLDMAISTINKVFNWVCPNRWELRLILFVTFAVIVSLLIISIWYYPLRSYLSKLPFVALSAAAIIGLMLVFIADPYFKDYQGPILLLFMLVIGLILFAVRWANKEGDKP